MSETSSQNPATLPFGIFLLVILITILIATGFPNGVVITLLSIAGLVFAFRYTYITLYLGIAFAPFIGIRVLISTGTLRIGERAFGGSIDVSLAEIILLFVLAAWAMKCVQYGWKRRNQQWLPRLPLLQSYGLLFLAHLLSAFSPLQPDPLLVLKYSLRPVFFSYLAFVALPVNLLRSRRRLVTAFVIVSAVGTFAAANGLVSMFFAHPPDAFIGRAHPMQIFGVSALGENHNELAEILVFTTFVTLALSALVTSKHIKRLLAAISVFQLLIGLFTFTRTAWIVFMLQGICVYWLLWREEAKRHARTICILGILSLPLMFGMLSYAVSESAASSNATRRMLTQIAVELFRSSPWFGAGAGTFVERVGSTHIFLLEYGDPLDSHGYLQKLATETGLLGLFAISLVYAQLGRDSFRGWKRIAADKGKRAYILLCTGAGGALFYQLFNTDYWTGKMWLPVGLVLAAAAVLKEAPRDMLKS